MFTTNCKEFVFGTTLIFAMTTGAHAQSEGLPSHALFDLTMSVDGSYEGVDLGEDRFGAIYRFRIGLENNAGSGFLHGAVSNCFAVGYFTDQPEHQAGMCTIVDADGDKILQRFHRSDLIGEIEFINGTGKYSGISGNGQYAVRSENTWQGNSVQSELKLVGAYHLPEAQSNTSLLDEGGPN